MSMKPMEKADLKHAGPKPARPTGVLVTAWDRYRAFARRRKALKAFNGLSDRTLRDIAVDRSEAISVVYGSAEGRRRSYVEFGDR